MVIRAKRIVIPAIVAFAALAVAGWTAAPAEDEAGLKLQGAWVARVTSVNDAPYPFVSQWTYVLAADPAGRKATLHGSIDVPLAGGGGGDYSTPLIGEIIQTGPDTVADKTIWYTIKKATPVNQIVNIGVATSEGRWVGPNQIEFTSLFSIYSPAADTNGDGIPEADAVPIATLTVKTLDTRVGL